MPDPVRQRILTRMGIQHWQLRRPALLTGATPVMATTPAEPAPEPQQEIRVPASSKIWLLASALPAAPLLADLCQLFGVTPDEIALLDQLPEQQTPPLLWLTAADSRWPDALVCPLSPTPEQKRQLWQQWRDRQSNPL